MQIDISHIPEQPGVYLFKDAKDKILYIGKAKNLQKRVSQYFAPNSLWKQEMVNQATKVDFFVVSNESESLYLENNLIKKHKPFFNCMLKGGNGYTYIKFTNSEFPQVLTTRMKRQDSATYIGPKHNTKELKKLMQYLRSLLKYRTCTNSQFSEGKVCSDFYFGLCDGWCEKCKYKDLKDQEEYKSRLQIFTSFFKGNTKPIEKEMRQQMDEAVKKENFEWAAKIRDMYLHIEELVERQHVELGKILTGYILAIKKIAQSNICILLNFYEGKLIDIVRQEILIDDGDINWIKSGFEAEIGDLVEQANIGGVSPFSFIAFSKGISFNKEEKDALIHMLEGFFDSYVVSTSLQGPGIQNELLLELQKRYHFKNFPNCIECVDISHMNGDRISGGLSCIIGGLPEKKRYRKYKINSVTGQSDDYASLKEILKRRFIEKIDLPDLPDVFILDGGIGQLNVVKDLCKESKVFGKIFNKVDFVSLGKGEARRKTRIGQVSKRGTDQIVGEKIYRFADAEFNIEEISLEYDQSDRFLIKLRDEAHRFSNLYRKQQMKSDLQSTFKSIKHK